MVTGDLNNPQGLTSEQWGTFQKERLDLDILLSPTELQYALYFCEQKVLLKAGIYSSPTDVSWQEQDLKSALLGLKDQLQPLNSVNCSWAGVPFTLSPSKLLKTEITAELIQMQYGAKAESDFGHRAILSDITAIYEKREDWKATITSLFPTTTFDLLLERQIADAIDLTKALSRSVVQLYQGSDFLQAVVIGKEKGLLLANLYETGSAEDTLYFVSHFFNSFQLDASTDQIVLSGNLGDGDHLFSMLSSHFKHVLKSDLPNSLQGEGFPRTLIQPILRSNPCG